MVGRCPEKWPALQTEGGGVKPAPSLSLFLSAIEVGSLDGHCRELNIRGILLEGSVRNQELGLKGWVSRNEELGLRRWDFEK